MKFCKAMRPSPRLRETFRSLLLSSVMAVAGRFTVRMESCRFCLAPAFAPLGLDAVAWCFHL
ncbi:hypothetical protein sync_1761 [Synechococcus sp. CC9311]|nr:hypothetical protein sync_1761 [Synechococcus sp. CC9311]